MQYYCSLGVFLDISDAHPPFFLLRICFTANTHIADAIRKISVLRFLKK